MSVHIAAESISRSVRQRFDAGPFSARVLAVFAHGLDLAADDGDVVAVVSARVGAGPLNVVVGARPDTFAQLEVGMPASLKGGLLCVGPLQVSVSGAVVWDPCPDWERLRACANACAQAVRLAHSIALRLAPCGSLLPVVDSAVMGERNRSPDPPATPDAVCMTVARALSDLRAGWHGDSIRLREGVAQLAGLGGGLTPAGDDWLCGAMLGAWWAHPDPAWLCERVLESVQRRTTLLSSAFLRAAGRGECSLSWHRLFAALSADSPAETEAAVRHLLSIGATSGADALAGFLWSVWPGVLGDCPHVITVL